MGLRVSEIRQVLVLVEHIGSGGGQTPPPKKHTNPRHWAPCSEGEGGSWGSGCPSPRGPALGWGVRADVLGSDISAATQKMSHSSRRWQGEKGKAFQEEG